MEQESKLSNLNSEFHGGRWNGLPVVQLACSDIWQSVPIAKVHKGRIFYDRILEDIQKNGLKFPLLVVHSTKREVQQQKKIYTNQLNDLPFWHTDNLDEMMYTVWGGSNRLAIAKQLGYHTVDCVILTDFKKARSMQKLHRAPYQGKYY